MRIIGLSSGENIYIEQTAIGRVVTHNVDMGDDPRFHHAMTGIIVLLAALDKQGMLDDDTEIIAAVEESIIQLGMVFR